MGGTERRTILLVEDDPVITMAETRGLQDSGYDVVTARSGEDAVRSALSTDAIDLVLMDINLGPGIDGTEAARRILAERTLPIVFLTSYSDRETTERLRGITRYGYVLKSSGNAVLQSSITMALELFESRNSVETKIASLEASEAALRESERRFRTLAAIVECSDDAIIGKDLNGTITSWNGGAERIYGYTEQEMVGTPISALLPPELADETSAILAQITAGERLVHYETVRRRKDGQRITMSLTISPVRDSEGRIVAASTIGRDISGRIRVEEALRESQLRYLAAVEQSNDGITIAALDGRYVMVNPAFCSMTGFTREELLLMRVTDLLPGATRLKLFPQVAIENHSGYREVDLLRKDGSIFNALIAGSPLSIGGDRFVQGIVQDVTRRKRDEEALRQAEKLKSLGTLAGGIAHDFNNVLAGIIGYTDMSLRYADKGSILERNLLKVLNVSERAKHLIQQILTFSRKATPHKSVISLRSVVDEVTELLNASIPSSVVIACDVSANTKPVLADATKIHEALLNLATNAVHAMNRKGRLTIRLFDECLHRSVRGQGGELVPGCYAVLEVADTGCGMDTPTLSKAFEPFYTTKGVGEGTGMGLSVVLGVVQSLGGDVLVETAPGRGTTFRLYFPTTEEPVEDSPGEGVPGRVYGTERILFVDDERMLVDTAKDLLSTLGYRVTGTSSSLDALNLLKEKGGEFDVLVTDQTMPDMSGIELADAARGSREGIPVILCTGFSDDIDPGNATAGGISRIMMKPYRYMDLARAIRDVIDATPASQS